MVCLKSSLQVPKRSMMKLLHLIPVLGPGGPTRSLLALIRTTKTSHPDVAHTIISLQPGDYMPLVFELKRQGVEILRAPGIDKTIAGIDLADVVLLHFWNTPSFWGLLASGLPAARYVVWSKVLGTHAPQTLNRRLLAEAGDVVFTAPPAAGLAARFTTARTVPGLIDRQHLDSLSPKQHSRFNVDYVGTTNRGKMHPRFIAMMSRLNIPDVRVRICGGALEPAMASAMAETPDPERFECHGFVENIVPILETSDVFAYPLAERTYATSDKSLQEAMLAGLAAVILPHGGPSRFITDGENGIIARSEDEFVAAIEHLHRNPDKRAALGRNARLTAQARFKPETHVAALMDVIEQASTRPRLPLLRDSGLSPKPAAVLFLMSQDWDEATAGQR